MSKYASSDHTKGLLINAAGELAAELGFSNVSTRAVAERSGENIGSIHYHFGGKDPLFEAVVNEAIQDIRTFSALDVMNNIGEEKMSPENISSVIEAVVHQHICALFDLDKPHWHSQVIYQLLQTEGSLYELFASKVMKPDMVAMQKLFRLIKPEISDDDIVLHTLILNMPIFSHASYMSTILRLLDTSAYSDEYLKKLEDLLVCQTQLLFDLPLTGNKIVKEKKES
jgi:AcrR family transcriptional regulator